MQKDVNRQNTLLKIKGFSFNGKTLTSPHVKSTSSNLVISINLIKKKLF